MSTSQNNLIQSGSRIISLLDPVDGFIEVLPITDYTNVTDIEFDLDVDAEQINLTLDALPVTDAVQLQLELWNGSIWVSTGFAHHIATSKDSSSAYAASAAATNNISGTLGNVIGLSMDITITGHQAGLFPVIKLDGIAVDDASATSKIEGMIIQTSTQEYTKARVKMSSGNIATGKALVYSSQFGPFLPLTTAAKQNMVGRDLMEFPMDDNPLNVVAIGNTAISVNASVRATVKTSAVQAANYKYHHDKTQSSSANYSANNAGSASNMDVITSLGNDAGRTGLSNIFIPNAGNTDLIKTITTIGGAYDNSGNARNAHSSMGYTGDTEALASLILVPSSGEFSSGIARKRKLQLFRPQEIGKIFGPFTFLAEAEINNSASFEIPLTDNCAVRHIVYLYDVVMSDDDSFLNLEFFQGGAWIVTNNKYHTTQTKSNNNSYNADASVTAGSLSFLRNLGNAAGESSMCIFNISQCGNGGMVISNGASVDASGNLQAANGAGRTTSTDQVMDIRFVPSSGTFSGKLLHYAIIEGGVAVINGFTVGFDPGFGFTNRFRAVFDTTQAGSASDTLILPISTNQDLEIDWGDGAGFVDAPLVANYTNVYTVGGTYTVTVREKSGGYITDWKYNNLGDKEKIIDLQSWVGLDFGVNGLGAFFGAINMIISATDIPKTDLMVSAGNFLRASGIVTTPLIDFSVCTGFSGTFKDCVNLIETPLYNLISLNGGGNMYDGCTSLVFVPAYNLPNMTNGVNFLLGVTLDPESWSNLLIAIEAVNSNPNVTLNGGNSLHNAAGLVALNALVNDHGWTITDGGPE